MHEFVWKILAPTMFEEMHRVEVAEEAEVEEDDRIMATETTIFGLLMVVVVVNNMVVTIGMVSGEEILMDVPTTEIDKIETYTTLKKLKYITLMRPVPTMNMNWLMRWMLKMSMAMRSIILDNMKYTTHLL